MADITVVLMTRNRVGELMESLNRLQQLPERPSITVVDNGSTDETRERVSLSIPARRPDQPAV